MATYLKDLNPGQFFEVDLFPGEWYLLTDDQDLRLDEYRFGVCYQTGRVRRFYLTELVTKVYLKASKLGKYDQEIIRYDSNKKR